MRETIVGEGSEGETKGRGGEKEIVKGKGSEGETVRGKGGVRENFERRRQGGESRE